DAASARPSTVGAVHSAVQKAECRSPRRAPFPRHIAPDAPVVIVVGPGVGQPVAASGDAHDTRRERAEAGNDIAGQELVFAKLDRGEVAIAPGAKLKLEANLTRWTGGARREVVDAVALTHPAFPNPKICPSGVERDPRRRRIGGEAIVAAVPPPVG